MIDLVVNSLSDDSISRFFVDLEITIQLKIVCDWSAYIKNPNILFHYKSVQISVHWDNPKIQL